MRGDDHMTGKREIFGTDGVRGLANAGAMTPDSILQLGMAVGRVFKNGAHRHRVVIGKDTRVSGYMFESALEAGLAAAGANVLLLDEPTNDLDVDTLRALEESLGDFAGCVLITSHDRWFLDRLATHIIAFEGNSEVVWFEGNYEAYEEDKKRRLGDAALEPHRIKYKKLTR